MKKILITGASGFVGQAFLSRVQAEKHYMPTVVVRKKIETNQPIEQIIIENLANADWSGILPNTEIVVHIAGRAHILQKTSIESLQAFRAVNVEATLALARQALAAGVKRFIFISSIAVNGQQTDKPFTELDQANPKSDYARSKYEAEQALQKLTANTSMELVIIRPPLVYGPKVKANFLSLMKWVKRGVPLPLGSVTNQRSFISITNLVDFMYQVLEHPNAANQIFLVADKEQPSTPELLKKVAYYMDKKIYLVPIPVSLLKLAARVLGRQHMASQLCDSLRIDISKANKLLGWEPPIRMDEAIKQTVISFNKEK